MSTTAEATPPWVELPREITATILHKLGAIEILTAAQSVCTVWQSVCRDPSMWRTIDMQNLGDLHAMPYDLEIMCRHAVDRSHGQLVDINIEYFGTDELLLYISRRCSQLKRLRLVFCYDITGEGLIEAVKKSPLLEELHLYYTHIDPEFIKAIGQSCPQLKSFTFNSSWYVQQDLDCDMDAQAIAESMPQLNHLRLFGNQMANEGLQAILDGCPHLESLDLRQCFNLRLSGNIGKLCTQRIKDLRHPDDSTVGYPFYCKINDHETWDYDYRSGLSDIDLESDYDYDYEYEDYAEFLGGSDGSDDVFDDYAFW